MYADINMMKQVFSAKVPANAKLVLFALIYHANKESGEAFPSWNLLARETGIGRSTIARLISQLVKAGCIVKRRRPGRQGSIYRIVPHGPAERPDSPAERPDTSHRETSMVSQRDPNKSIEQKNTTQASTLFEEFWGNYPDNCPRKVDRELCRERYAKLLAAASDPIRFHQIVMAGLGKWRRSELWNLNNGQFIRAPFKWLDRHSWEDEPSANGETGVKRKVPAEPPKWTLCKERCRNCTGNGCAKGVATPPEQSNPPYPPQECRHFVAL